MNILQKHQNNLLLLRSKIKTVALALGISLTTFAASELKAQSIHFDTAQVNPFNLSNGTVFPFITSGDLDNDGDLDLLFGNGWGSSVGNFEYLQNTGTASAPAFAAKQTNPFNLNSTPGARNKPRLVDLDNDGDLDILATDAYNNFLYYQNSGTATNPNFVIPQTNPFNLVPAASTSRPTFDLADLDNDGDLDILQNAYNPGVYAGSWYYYENISTTSALAFANPQINLYNLQNQSVNEEAFFSFTDLDEDGDQDILHSVTGFYSNDSSFYYIENTGSLSVPSFATSQVNPFGLIKTNTDIAPSFADLDGDGDKDILTGLFNSFSGPNGSLYYIENTSCLNSDISQSADTLRAPAGYRSYRWLDCASNTFTGVTTRQLVPGRNGTFRVVLTQENCSDTSACFNFVLSGVENTNSTTFQLFPNPAREFLTIETPLLQNANVRIINLNGKTVISQNNLNTDKISLSLHNLPTAIYIVEINNGQQVLQQKFIKE